MKKNHLLIILLSIMTTGLTSVFMLTNSADHGERDKFIHTVYFWYNDGTSADEIAAFKSSMMKLAEVSSISKVYYGGPADTNRGVIDNTYDFAWITHFKSKKEHDLYQEDPVHLKMINDHEHIWEKVVVYDNINENAH